MVMYSLFGRRLLPSRGEYHPFLPFAAAKGLLRVFLKQFSMIFLITPSQQFKAELLYFVAKLSCYRTIFLQKKYIIIIVLCQDKYFKGEYSMARIIDGERKNMVGNKVREFRIARKMSQQRLSDKLETIAVYICRGSVSRIEDGTRTVSDIELYGLSKILGVPVGDFFEE